MCDSSQTGCAAMFGCGFIRPVRGARSRRPLPLFGGFTCHMVGYVSFPWSDEVLRGNAGSRFQWHAGSLFPSQNGQPHKGLPNGLPASSLGNCAIGSLHVQLALESATGKLLGEIYLPCVQKSLQLVSSVRKPPCVGCSTWYMSKNSTKKSKGKNTKQQSGASAFGFPSIRSKRVPSKTQALNGAPLSLIHTKRAPTPLGLPDCHHL